MLYKDVIIVWIYFSFLHSFLPYFSGTLDDLLTIYPNLPKRIA